MTTTIVITGVEEVLSQLGSIGGREVIAPALKAAAVHVRGKVDRYPMATEANSPAQPRWYERGYGPRWRRRDGTVGGYKTSETLNRKWTVEERAGGMEVVVGNNVSYSPYVHDKDHQAQVHARRGWKTAQDVIEQEAPAIRDFIESEIKRRLGRA